MDKEPAAIPAISGTIGLTDGCLSLRPSPLLHYGSRQGVLLAWILETLGRDYCCLAVGTGADANNIGMKSGAHLTLKVTGLKLGWRGGRTRGLVNSTWRQPYYPCTNSVSECWCGGSTPSSFPWLKLHSCASWLALKDRAIDSRSDAELSHVRPCSHRASIYPSALEPRGVVHHALLEIGRCPGWR